MYIAYSFCVYIVLKGITINTCHLFNKQDKNVLHITQLKYQFYDAVSFDFCEHVLYYSNEDFEISTIIFVTYFFKLIC